MTHTPNQKAERSEADAIRDDLRAVVDDFLGEPITNWKQGRYIRLRQYDHLSEKAHKEHYDNERTLIRPGGGTHNALFQIGQTSAYTSAADITEYLEKLGAVIGKILHEK